MMEDVVQRHRKEKKDLQNQIQALKKTVTKGDKKKKKEVSEEIAKLELEIENRHCQELAELKITSDESDADTMKVEPSPVENDDGEEPANNTHRITKAQKRREKKALKEKEREQMIIAQEEENKSGARNVETQKIKQLLKVQGLMIHEIPSDGNCLYAAVDYQRKVAGLQELGLVRLRQITSQYLKDHREEFLPFLCHPDTGRLLTDEQFEEYCGQVANTSAWGGEVELRALSHALHCQIEVIQASGPSVFVGEEYKDGAHLIIAYHRHMYGLGEHYNSVKPLVASQQDEDDQQVSQNVNGH